MKNRIVKPGQLRGFTLVESLVVLAIVSILAKIMVPSFQTLRLNLLHRESAELMESFIQRGRAAAIHTNKPVFISVMPKALCMGADFTAQCDCSISDGCEINQRQETVQINQSLFTFESLRFANEKQLRFNPRLGTAVGFNGSFTLSSAVAKVKVIVSGLGRSRLCVSQGSVSGVPAC